MIALMEEIIALMEEWPSLIKFYQPEKFLNSLFSKITNYSSNVLSAV
jgi:hypothetical protein